MSGILFRLKCPLELFVHSCCYSKEGPGFNQIRKLCWPHRFVTETRYGYHINNYLQNVHHVLNENVSFIFARKCSQLGKTTLTETCWKCEKVIKSLGIFCDSCNTLQPVNKSADFYQILGIIQSYNIDYHELRKKYLSLQTLLHPDKFSSKLKEEQKLSEEFSSVVNKAYFTLLNPLERGLYLLSLHNLSIEEGTKEIDHLFLMEIMERNEEMEHEKEPQKLNEYYMKNKEQLNILVEKVGAAFDSNDLVLLGTIFTNN